MRASGLFAWWTSPVPIYSPDDDREHGEDSIAGPERIPKTQFEEWGPHDEQLRMVVTQPVRTSHGRMLQIGDRVTPREAREEKIPVVEAADVERPTNFT